MPLLFDRRHLRRAARQCMRRCSGPGADLVTWADYRRRFDERISVLSDRLRRGSWRPGRCRQVVIETFTGKRMAAVIPVAEDRIVQRAMRNAMEPVLEARVFPEFVSGFRPGRNRLTAVAQAARHHDCGCLWAADVDVAAVSQGGTAEEVIRWLRPWITDGTFLALVRTALADLPCPLVPGTGLSPLLVNVRLVPVDQWLSHLRVVRFCDNYCVFARTREDADRALTEATSALRAIGLAPSQNKSRVHLGMNPEDLFLIAG